MAFNIIDENKPYCAPILLWEILLQAHKKGRANRRGDKEHIVRRRPHRQGHQIRAKNRHTSHPKSRLHQHRQRTTKRGLENNPPLRSAGPDKKNQHRSLNERGEIRILAGKLGKTTKLGPVVPYFLPTLFARLIQAFPFCVKYATILT